MTNWLLLLVIAVPVAGTLAVLLSPRAQDRIAVVVASLTVALSLLLLPSITSAPAGIPLFDLPGVFIPDGLGVLLTVIAAVIGCLVVIFSADYMRGESSQRRYYALVLIFIAAMSGLVLSNSFLLLFICWEITALCSYALISFHNDERAAVEGGIRALVVTQLGGIGLLAGILLIRSHLATDQISVFLAEFGKLPPEAISAIAIGFLLAAAAKSAQVPFHIWLPGAMEAPTPISALIHAATMVNAGVYLLTRFYPAFAGIPGWTTAVVFVGLLSALLGSIMALVSNDLKRVLAYSTISQLGFMVYAVGVGGLFASHYHLLSHAVFKALLFLGAGAIIHAVGTRDMTKMGGLRKQMPFTHATFVVGALALVGIPIFNGFWSKELILEASAEHAPAWATALMIACVGLTALYTTRMLWMVFYAKPHHEPHTHDVSRAMRIALGVLAAGVLTTWLLALPLAISLQKTLPFHEIHIPENIFAAILSAPVTWAALVIVALGAGLWTQRQHFQRLPFLRPIAALASADFGFDWLTRMLVQIAQSAAERARDTQTGQLNWNVVQIVAGFLIVLVILAVGGNP